MNILIVDDSPTQLKLLAMPFKNSRNTIKYNISTAKNGKEAFEMITTHNNYYIIVLDMHMPEWSGEKCLKELIAYEKKHNIVLYNYSIIVTGDNMYDIYLKEMNRVKDFVVREEKTYFFPKNVYFQNMKYFIRIIENEFINQHTYITEPIVLENIVIMFSDIIGYTKLCHSIKDDVFIANILQQLYLNMNTTGLTMGINKYSIIGDGYMCACNCHDSSIKNISQMLLYIDKVIDILDSINKEFNINLKMRFGVHIDNVSLVYLDKNTLTLIGNGVNYTSRLESYKINNEVNDNSIRISRNIYQHLPNKNNFIFYDEIIMKGYQQPQPLFINCSLNTNKNDYVVNI